MTCKTCLTLNPPGAPACVRCNTPLGDPAADPTEGSRRIGPGLAAAPKGAPGSSRDRAVPVQPPGYGLTEEEPPPPPPPAPVEDPSIARRVTVAGLVVVVLVLLVGGGALWVARPRYLDTSSVQRSIAADLSARGGGAVTVSCPGQIRLDRGARFACVATDTTGSKRTVTVALVDKSGKFTWQLGTA
jgi:Domain of unknown function (DUF4333)